MKKSHEVIFALCMLGGIFSNAFAEDSIPFEKAVEEGRVESGITGLGGPTSDRLESDKISRKGRVYLETEPEEATVRILNIRPKFYNGIKLDPGTYHVEVSASGYETKRMWVYVAGGETNEYSVHLEPVTVQPLPEVKTEELQLLEEMLKLAEEYQRLQEMGKSIEEYQRLQEMSESIAEYQSIQEDFKLMEEMKSLDLMEIPEIESFSLDFEDLPDLEGIQRDIEKWEKLIHDSNR